MNSITRWDQQFRHTDAPLREYEDGRYVLYSDHFEEMKRILTFNRKRLITAIMALQVIARWKVEEDRGGEGAEYYRIKYFAQDFLADDLASHLDAPQVEA